jgi:ketosteroid isomerase-like protein
MTNSIPVEDHVAIQNLIGEYQWLVDGGDSDGWAMLWTEDGAFVGGATEPFVGHDALKQVPAWVKASWDGQMRHMTGSLFIRYGDNQDEAIARYYSLVTTWHEEPPALFVCALCEMTLRRIDGVWKISRNHVTNLGKTREPGATN